MAVKTFTSGEILTAADTNTYLANAGLVYVKSQTIGSAVSSVTVSNAFSSTYDQYVITISGGAASAGGILLGMALGASTTGYYQARNGITYSTGARSDGADNNTAKWTVVGLADTNGLYANVSLGNPFLAKYTYGTCGYDNGAVGLNVFLAHKVATSYSAFTLTTSSGTITGGTITVYGYRLG